MVGSANGDLLSTGDCTDVASANRVVLGLFNDGTGESESLRWFAGAAPGAVGCDESAIAVFMVVFSDKRPALGVVLFSVSIVVPNYFRPKRHGHTHLDLVLCLLDPI